MRPLHRTRADVKPLGGMKLSVEIERLTLPALLHDRDAFLDTQPALGAIRAERLIIVKAPATADADVEPPAADDVEDGKVVRAATYEASTGGTGQMP